MSSLETAAAILKCFSADHVELSVSEVARRLDLPKSTVSRLMKSMASCGLVEQHRESRHYRVGVLPFRLGGLYQAHNKVLEMADDALADLVEATGFTGYAGVLNGTDITILRLRQGRYPVRIVLEPGSRVPAFTTAFGKALLARLSNEELKRRLPPISVHKPTGLRRPVAKIIDELDLVRQQGWASASQETVAGIGAIGAAVGSSDEQQPVGFALSFPANAVDKKRHEDMVARLLEAAAKIATRTGDPLWAGPLEPTQMQRRAARRESARYATTY